MSGVAQPGDFGKQVRLAGGHRPAAATVVNDGVAQQRNAAFSPCFTSMSVHTLCRSSRPPPLATWERQWTPSHEVPSRDQRLRPARCAHCWRHPARMFENPSKLACQHRTHGPSLASSSLHRCSPAHSVLHPPDMCLPPALNSLAFSPYCAPAQALLHEISSLVPCTLLCTKPHQPGLPILPLPASMPSADRRHIVAPPSRWTGSWGGCLATPGETAAFFPIRCPGP